MKREGSFDQLSRLDAEDAKTDVKIEWKGINFSIDTKNDGKKTILHDVNGNARSGEMVAILGHTGCGKTSLLNVLSGRVPAMKNKYSLTGQILVNGAMRNDEEFRRVSAYVMQEDMLFAHLTVYETLYLATQFHLGKEISEQRKLDLVESVLNELGLQKVRDVPVGDNKIRGISGGERKRTSIAVQLISNPRILFMDEPTSGLDSFQAQSVMSAMRGLTGMGKLVFAVIHQPRSTIFDMFDKIILMAGGSVVYMGYASKATEFFGRLGHPCPALYNPADFFVDILSPDTRTDAMRNLSAKRIEDIKNAKELAATYAQDSMSKEKQGVGEAMVPIRPHVVERDIHTYFRHVQLLGWRAYTRQIRDIPTIVIKLLITVVFAFIIAGIFSDVGHTQQAIMARTGLLFVSCINQGFNAMTGVLTVFPIEKQVVSRERSTHAYDLFTYFLAKFIVEIPLNVLPCTVFGCILYYIVGLNPAGFGNFIAILMMESLTAISLGLCVSAAAPTLEVANNFGPLPLIVALLFGGWFINLDSLPVVADWIAYLSFLRWAFQALVINEFSGVTFTCNYPDPTMCETTGEQVIARMGFTGSYDDAMMALGLTFLGFLGLAYLILYYSKPRFVPIDQNEAPES